VDHERPERPEGPECVNKGLTDAIWGVLVHCWADDRKLRPTFKEISGTLESAYFSPTLGKQESMPNESLTEEGESFCVCS
jgi:hypothetical protein